MTEGQIVNKWFNTLPTTLKLLKGKTNSLMFSTQDQKTELICGALNIPIKDGVAVSQDKIALETDTLNFIINGKIDLKNETVDLTMLPSVSQTRGMANELLNVAQSVSLTGPWSAIETKVNVGDAVGNLAQTAIQKLAGKETSKQTTQAVNLCQKVLGRTLTQTKTTKVQQKVESKPTNTQTKTQPNLKQQLIQSLSQALTDQVASEKK